MVCHLQCSTFILVKELATQFKDEGNEFFKQKQFDKAVESYSKAIEADPNSHVLYSNRSFAHNKLKQWKESLADAKKSIELQPGWVKVQEQNC
jgi:stress-induced-phosphoprotein 1